MDQQEYILIDRIITGHQPIQVRVTVEEARRREERVERIKLMKLVWAAEALENQKKHFKQIEILK